MILSTFASEVDFYILFCGGTNRQSWQFAEHVLGYLVNSISVSRFFLVVLCSRQLI